MFQAPKGWQHTWRSDNLLFFDATKLKEGQTCRIAVVSPSEISGGFKEWFSLIQAPDPVIEESRIEEGKTMGGYEMLRQTRVVRKEAGNLHRMYVGLRDGNRFVLVLYTANDKELFEAHTKEVKALVDSWDFTGQFPVSEDKNRE